MPRKTERLPLFGGTPGCQRELLVHRYGRPGGNKAYMHAALHADETPGLLVLHHLIQLLDAADAKGEIVGEIVVVPYANPIGLSQWLNASHAGRHELGGGGNFNRNWPDFAQLIGDRLDGALGGDADANVATIREELRDAVERIEPRNELHSLRRTLASLAVDADLVLDIHCDDDALMHVFMIPQHWPKGAELAAALQVHAVLLAENSGGNSFDEAFSSPWIKLQQRYEDRPIPPACFSCTVELRGQSDVSDALAEPDAQALFKALQHYGFISGDPGPLSAPLCDATDLAATDTIRAPAAGVLSYVVELGQRVKKGDLVAWLIDPAAEDPATGRTAIRSGAEGLVLSRRRHKYVPPGYTVAKVAGTEVLAHRKDGYLLED